MQTKLFSILTLLLALTGCATPPQTPVSLDGGVLARQDNRIGIAMDVIPSADLQLPGADCLLCLMVAVGVNSDLDTYAKTLSTDEIGQLKADVNGVLDGQGLKTVIIEEPLSIDKLPKTNGLADGFSKRDFSGYAEQYQIDSMIVIDINVIGMTRPYASYIPTGAPQATVRGAVSMIDLKTNQYDWYLPIDLYMSAEGEWDEPKNFPGLTNAYYQVIESLRDMVLAPLDVPQVVSQSIE